MVLTSQVLGGSLLEANQDPIIGRWRLLGLAASATPAPKRVCRSSSNNGEAAHPRCLVENWTGAHGMSTPRALKALSDCRRWSRTRDELSCLWGVPCLGPSASPMLA